MLYSQVIEEKDGLGDVTKSYTIGDDVISQTVGADTQYLLYDGLGSTRQLLNSDGSAVDESYSYDAYGVMLGSESNPKPVDNAATSLLYTGEQYDSALQQYYLRARYYNPYNGSFNRTDPFAGNNQDPQSLHKYLYCHANPVNGIDPSGFSFTFIGLVKVIAIVAVITALVIGIDRLLGGPSYRAGLGHSSIKDEDIVTAISGFKRATEVLEETIEPIENCPVTVADLIAILESRGVHQVGEMLVGAVGEGLHLSPGYQRIVNYFESFLWNLFHPQATEHPNWLLQGSQHPYLGAKAEVKRMKIIIRELEVEARRREIPGY